MMILLLFTISILVLRSNSQGNSRTSFSCDQRPSGYYADMETGCQVYHMCDGLGRQFSYSCPSETLFQQRMLICDHWYMVNCSKSEVDYRANLLIGQRDKKFLEDSENFYDRTPRPDLLINNQVPEYNSVHRDGRSQSLSNLNLVGVVTDSENNNSSNSDQPKYSLPSHWFTAYSKNSSSTKQEERSPYVKQKYYKSADDINRKTIDDKTKQKPVINDNGNLNLQNKNEANIEILPTPLSKLFKKKPITPPNITEQPFIQNNFPESTVTKSRNVNVNPLDLNTHTDNNVPIKILPPETRKKEMQWEELRKLFLIPDYEFPLDSVTRPGYDNGQSSFEVNFTVPRF